MSIYKEKLFLVQRRSYEFIEYFQGQCRYTLVTDDCALLNRTSALVNGVSPVLSGKSTFSVQVFNDPRRSKHYSWTRGLLIRVDKHKVH